MRSDVYLFDTRDGGDVTVDLEIRDGLESSIYLSLFGGNTKDDGRQTNVFNWWGNIDELIAARVYRSEAAFLLKTVPPTAQNLRRIEDAAKRDLAWVIDEDVSKTLQVQASMPQLNTVKLKIFLDGISPLEFQSFWGEREAPGISPPVVTENTGIVLRGTGLPGAVLRIVRADESVIEVNIDADGNWSFSPYPLNEGEIATAYVVTLSGRASRGVVVVGVGALYYDGVVYYDGIYEYDGSKA
ncbi:MAG: hypothetical protein RR182_01050 [Alistipes sp.]